MTRICVVDDERAIRRAVRTSLEAHGYEVVDAATGAEALDAASRADLILLDLGLPDLDGSEVIALIRSFSDVPIIVLSVRGAQGEKVRALDAGADDYLTKPFAMEELLARARATFRRAGARPTIAEPLHRFGDLEIDLARRSVTRSGVRISLTPHEHGLLAAFVMHPGTLLTHRQLLERVWDRRAEVDSLRHAVRSLRVKLGDTAAAPELITTEPGLGYRWIGEADEPT